MQTIESFGRPRLGELLAVVLAGASHVALELLASEAVAFVWSAVVVVGFGVYLLIRAGTTPNAARAWGMRIDNLGAALTLQLGFAVAGSVALLLYGAITGSLGLPATFWLTLGLYPIWGVAQQFALQSLVANNLTGLVRSPLRLSIVAAGLFAASHYPRLDLVLLTFAVGIPFTLFYRRVPNLWAVGLAHGILGTLAAYVVLGEDPGRVILGWLG